MVSAARFYSIVLVIAISQFLFISAAPILGAAKLLKEAAKEAAKEATKEVKGTLFSGLGTYYKVGSGSCGKFDTDSELVVALNKVQMANGSNPNKNPQCDKMVTITGDKGTVKAKIVDTCPSCANGSLDMSPTTFKKVCGDLEEGVCTINWKFL